MSDLIQTRKAIKMKTNKNKIKCLRSTITNHAPILYTNTHNASVYIYPDIILYAYIFYIHGLLNIHRINELKTNQNVHTCTHDTSHTSIS